MGMKELFLITPLPSFILILETSAVHMACIILIHHCLEIHTTSRPKPQKMKWFEHRDFQRNVTTWNLILWGMIGLIVSDCNYFHM